MEQSRQLSAFGEFSNNIVANKVNHNDDDDNDEDDDDLLNITANNINELSIQDNANMTENHLEDTTANNNTKRTAVSIELAKKESIEHMIGLDVVYNNIRCRSFLFNAYSTNHIFTNDQENNNNNQSLHNIKTIHLIRHGQGYHNLIADISKQNNIQWTNFIPSSTNPYIMNELLDPPLTNLGREQALLLQQKKSQSHQLLDMIIVSPLCRTLQTAMIVYENEIVKDNIPCLAHELVREEMGIHICDQRRSKDQYEIEFPYINFQLLSLSNNNNKNENKTTTLLIDPLFQSNVRETKQQVANRIYDFLIWLYNDNNNNEHNNIAIVSHSSWLLTLLNGVCHFNDESMNKEWFQTGEKRTIQLEMICNIPNIIGNSNSNASTE